MTTRMNVNVYLPDDLGRQAKAELPRGRLSQLLQAAVVDELERRAAMSKTLEAPETFKVEIDADEGGYTGRITGKVIAEDDDVTVYLTTDERVIAYDANKLRYKELGNEPRMSFDEEMRAWLPDAAAYSAAMLALGEKPVIDI